MSTIYFTPGPSHLYPTYQQHLKDAMELQLGSINHRSTAFRKIYQHTDEQLRILMDIPSTHSIFFASSATEIWEKMISGLVESQSFHLTNGAFSSKFYEFAKALKKSSLQLNVNEGEGFNVDTISVPDETELICTTQNETSTGVQIPVEDLIRLKNNYPNTLLCTDLVSVAPYSQIDFKLMDSAFFSVQKAFGMPPGLGVWIVNEYCIAKAEQIKNKGLNVGAHNTIENYVKNYKTFETPSTPNVMAIYILGKIAQDMNEYGIHQLRSDIDTKAAMIYSFAEMNTQYTPLVKRYEHRSQTVIVLNTSKPSADIIESLKPFHMSVGSGYGKLKASQIRIANFPATSIEEMERLLDVLSSME